MTCHLNKAVMKQNCIEALNQHTQPLIIIIIINRAGLLSPEIVLSLLTRGPPSAFSALTLSVGRQEKHLACIN